MKIAAISAVYIGLLVHCGVDSTAIETRYRQRIDAVAHDDGERERARAMLQGTIERSMKQADRPDAPTDACNEVRATGAEAFRDVIDGMLAGKVRF